MDTNPCPLGVYDLGSHLEILGRGRLLVIALWVLVMGAIDSHAL